MLVDDDDYRWSGDRLGSDFRFGYVCCCIIFNEPVPCEYYHHYHHYYTMENRINLCFCKCLLCRKWNETTSAADVVLRILLSFVLLPVLRCSPVIIFLGIVV